MKKNRVKHNLLVGKQAYGWLFGAICSVPLIGCQTLQTPINTNGGAGVTNLDKPSVLTSAWYREQLAANQSAYQHQFANLQGVRGDNEARSVLLQAIKQHLSTDHVAVSETRIHDRPFVQEGSVDTLADSVYVTLI